MKAITIKNEKMLTGTLPNFLSFPLNDFSFEFAQTKQQPNKKANLEKLLKQYKNPNTILLYNGVVLHKDLPAGIAMDTLQSKPNFFKTYQTQNTKEQLQQLNKIQLNSGLQINVQKNVQVQPVLQVVVAGDKNLSHYANYQLQENAQVCIEEQFVLFENVQLNYMLQTELKKDAQLNQLYVEMLKGKKKKANSVLHRASLQENAVLQLSYFNLNSAKTVHDTQVKLLGQNANASICTYTVCNKDVSLGSLISVTHLAKQTTSNIENVGIVNDFAKLSIDGLNIIEKGNAKSVADQESKIINLTDTARSVANPQLIINEYDVKAGHAASVGQMDEDQIYYLMSRGLTRVESKKLLLLSYLNSGLEKITNKRLQKRVLKEITHKIA